MLDGPHGVYVLLGFLVGFVLAHTLVGLPVWLIWAGARRKTLDRIRREAAKEYEAKLHELRHQLKLTQSVPIVRPPPFQPTRIK